VAPLVSRFRQLFLYGCRADFVAGGVVGLARTSYEFNSRTPVVGFDMGGTSTDVSRYGGAFEHVFESITAGVTIQSPQLVSTWWLLVVVPSCRGETLFVVGPESASSHPGPTCYRKGGPLAVTDAILFLGSLIPDYSPRYSGRMRMNPLASKLSGKS